MQTTSNIIIIAAAIKLKITSNVGLLLRSGELLTGEKVVPCIPTEDSVTEHNEI